MMSRRLPPSERRHERRREDDADQNVVEGFSRWMALMLAHKIKVGAIISLLSTLGGYVLGVKKVDALEVRVTRVEARQQVMAEDITGLKFASRIQNYMLCTARDTTTARELNRLCDIIIKAGLP